jgi:two-component system chemotaxis sensor kinase CheA
MGAEMTGGQEEWMAPDASEHENSRITGRLTSRILLLRSGDRIHLGPFTEDLDALSRKPLPPEAASLLESMLVVCGSLAGDGGDWEGDCAELERQTSILRAMLAGHHRPDDLPSPSDCGIGDLDRDACRNLLVRFAHQLRPALEDFEACILSMDGGGEGPAREARRMLHNWKGEFGILGMEDYARLVHSLEELVQGGGASADVLFRFKDFLEGRAPAFMEGDFAPLDEEGIARILDGIGKDAAPVPPDGKADEETDALAADPSLVEGFLAESQDHLAKAESFLLELGADLGNLDHLNGVFRCYHSIKGVAGFLGFRNIVALAHEMETRLDQARTGKIRFGETDLDLLLEGNDCLVQMMDGMKAAGQPYRESVPPCHGPFLAKLVAAAAGAQPGTADTGTAKPEARAAAPGKPGQEDSGQRGAARSSDTIRVPVDRLDQLIDCIGEAVIANAMVAGDPLLSGSQDASLRKKVARAALIMRQIQQQSMSLRMVSVRPLFQKLARLVRDLAPKAGKRVQLEMAGEETELDKSVVENLGDPLIHMIRNALDHGVEAPADRLAAGKPEVARLGLRAYHQGGNIHIELEDDGRGLDTSRILAKAVERGLARPEDHLGEEEIRQFIFHPGFSTAEKVTDISGRGVGMDVVKRNIEALRGSIEIASRPGLGTRFTIRLPLTLAIIDGMVVRVGSNRYIIPTLAILESFKPKPERLSSLLGRGELVDVRGSQLRLLRLGPVLGEMDACRNPADGIAMVVEDVARKRAALLVDEIVDQQQVVIKGMGEGMGQVPCVSGAAIMSSGTVSLILDVGQILKSAAEAADAPITDPAKAAEERMIA